MTIDIGFSKIRDFEYVAKRIIENSQFHGVRPPVIEFVGTVKIHGCNLGICQKPDGRLEQGIFKLQEKLLDPKDIKNTSVYVRWVVGDVADELGDKIKELGLDARAVAVAVGKQAAAYFKNHIKQGDQSDAD